MTFTLFHCWWNMKPQSISRLFFYFAFLNDLFKGWISLHFFPLKRIAYSNMYTVCLFNLTASSTESTIRKQSMYNRSECWYKKLNSFSPLVFERQTFPLSVFTEAGNVLKACQKLPSEFLFVWLHILPASVRPDCNCIDQGQLRNRPGLVWHQPLLLLLNPSLSPCTLNVFIILKHASHSV